MLEVTKEDIIREIKLPKTIILRKKLAYLLEFEYKKKPNNFNLGKWVNENLTEEIIIKQIEDRQWKKK